jgi:hypothetical protein
MNAPKDTTAIIAKRRQFEALTARLAELRAQYDVLMNAFKFEEARALHPRIDAAECEHRELIARLPPSPPDAPPAPYSVARRRRR